MLDENLLNALHISITTLFFESEELCLDKYDSKDSKLIQSLAHIRTQHQHHNQFQPQ